MAANELSKCPVKELVAEGSQECKKEILMKINNNLTDNTNNKKTKSTDSLKLQVRSTANSESIEKDEKQDGFPEPLRLRGGKCSEEIDNSNKKSEKINEKNEKERGNVTDEVKQIENELETSENCSYEAEQTQDTLIRIIKEEAAEENQLIYTEINDKSNKDIIKHLCEDLKKSILENEKKAITRKEEDITPDKVTEMSNKDPFLCTDSPNSCTQDLIMCDACRKKIEQEIFFITNKIESGNEENEETKQFELLPIEVVFEVEYGDTNATPNQNRSEENVQSCVNEAEVVWQKWQEEDRDFRSNQRVEVIPGQVLQAWQIWQASQVGQAWLSCQSLKEQQLTGLVEFARLGLKQNCEEETRECRGAREKWRKWIQIGQN